MAKTLKFWGCTSAASTETLEANKIFGITKHPLTCKSIARDHVVKLIEKNIEQKVDAQVKRRPQWHI